MATPTNSLTVKINKISLHPNDVILDKYRIIEVIGHGGMNSDIYKAEDISHTKDEWFSTSDKYVAIKMVNRGSETTDADWMKIHDECVTAKRASNCQNIVRTYDVADINNGNTVIIVMEYVNGISLNNYLAKVGNINVKEALFIFEKILDAIKELHGFQHKIIHRDLKPENIMLTNDMTKVKIIDFGISSVLTTSKTTGDKKALTDETSVFGSFPYMCPETLDVARSSREMKSKIISEQFDFFSLGVILYEMLIGQKPFSYEKEDASICHLPLQYDLMCISDINPEIPVAVENIIFKCMASKPEDKKNRYHSVDEIIHDVRAVINGDTSNDAVQLIKPRNERTFQGKIVFNVNAQRLKEKFYEKQWFYWLMFSIAMVVALLIIVISLLHDWK